MADIFKWLDAYTPTQKRNPREDRLTASLGYLLSASARFKRAFFKWVFSNEIKERRLTWKILRNAEVEMHPEYSLNIPQKDKKRAVPDLLIHAGENAGFVLFIESKWGADAELLQIEKYKNILENDFAKVQTRKLVLLCRDRPTKMLQEIENICDIKTWDELFDNVVYPQKTDTQVEPFFEFAQEDLNMGSFTGIPAFSPDDNPFALEKAKRLLERIIESKEIQNWMKKSELRIVKKPSARQGGNYAWVPIGPKNNDTRKFYKYPQLTLSLEETAFEISVILPYGVRSVFRKNLLDSLKENAGKNFYIKLWECRSNLGPIAEYWIKILQRHAYAGQTLVEDAKSEYKIDVLGSLLPEEAKSFESDSFKRSDFSKNALLEALMLIIEKEVNIEIDFAARYYVNDKCPAAKNRQKKAQQKGRKSAYPDIHDRSFIKEVERALDIQLRVYRTILSP